MVNDSHKSSMYDACLLHSKADRALRMVVAKELEPFEITMMQWLLLATVCKGSDAGTRMTELAAALDVTMPQITALMNDLVELKLAKQKINSADRRSRRLMATPLGKRQIEKIDKAIDKSLNNWLSAIPADDMKGYFATIRHMSEMSNGS